MSRSNLQDRHPTVTPSTKKYWKICYMNIDPMHAEMNPLMPDWSPSGPTPLNTRINGRLDPFMQSQRDKLLHLREGLTESMAVVTERSSLTRSEGSRVGIHPADAGSDAYDRDFALSLLSREFSGATRWIWACGTWRKPWPTPRSRIRTWWSP